MPQQRIPIETLVDLGRRLDQLPPRSSARRKLVQETASVYGVSQHTLYRALRTQGKQDATARSDQGRP